jgi:hypothetical protein
VDLLNIRGKAKILGDVGVVLWRMVTEGDEADAEVFWVQEAAVGDDVSADTLDVDGRVGNVGPLRAGRVLDEHEVAGEMSEGAGYTDGRLTAACARGRYVRCLRPWWLRARWMWLTRGAGSEGQKWTHVQRPRAGDDMHADAAAIIQNVLSAVPNDLRAAEAILDAVISTLCLQLVRVQACISANAPVARLPDDVLSQIFSIACRAPSAPHAATSSIAAALAGTSRRWRTLVLEHPALWTRIDLRHPSGAWALRYSRRLPVQVRLDAPLWKDARDGPLARIVAPHVPRVRQLWIQTGAVHADAFLRAIAGPSQLERLTLTGRYTDEHAITLPPALLSRLRHLSLTHAHLSPSTQLPHGLLTLSLKPPPAAPPLALASLATLLRASPGLTELSLHGGAVPVYKSAGDEDPSARADLARLRSLRVSGVGPVQVRHPQTTLASRSHACTPIGRLVALPRHISRLCQRNPRNGTPPRPPHRAARPSAGSTRARVISRGIGAI